MLKVNQLVGFNRRKLVVAGAPAIVFVGAAQGEGGDACSIGSTGRQSGDLLLWIGGIAHGGDDMTVPTDFTAIGTQVKTGGGGVGVGIWAARKYSDGTETSVDGAAAVSQAVVVLRNIHASAPIGDTDNSTSTSGTTVTYDALTMAAATSWAIAAAVVDDEQTDVFTAPSGMTERALTGNTFIGSLVLGVYSLGPTGTFTSRTSTKTSGRHSATLSLEILVAA